MEVPKIRGTVLGVARIRIIVFWGCPLFRETPHTSLGNLVGT